MRHLPGFGRRRVHHGRDDLAQWRPVLQLKPARSLCRFLCAAGLLCSAAILIGLLGDLWFPLDVAAHFRLHLGVAALIVGALCAPCSRVVGGGVLACGLLALALLGPALEGPERTAASGDTLAVTVAIANVDIANATPKAAEAALAELDADVLVTLESQMDFAKQESPLSPLYANVVRRVKWLYTGAWLWSKVPVISGGKIDNGMRRPAMVWGRLALPGGVEATVLGLHFRRPVTQPQEMQIDGMLAALPPLSGPLIVVGDFNAAPWSAAVSRVARQLGVTPVGGLRMTWRSKLAGWLGPLGALLSLPIDHAMVSPGVGVDWIRSVAIPGSDHRGLLMKVQIPRTSAPTASATQE